MRYKLNSAACAAAVIFLGTSFAFADDELPIPADDLVFCTVCHGVQLMGNPIIEAPRLSGMEAWYVEQQLKSFKKGLRGAHDGDILGHEMQPMAEALSEQQIHEAAAFVNATRSEPAPVTVNGDAEKGKAYFSTCAACHGVNGEGNQALGSPALTIVNDWYLVTQLMNFKNGSRGATPGDIYGMQMRASVQMLPDEKAIADVVSYITTLRK